MVLTPPLSFHVRAMLGQSSCIFHNYVHQHQLDNYVHQHQLSNCLVFIGICAGQTSISQSVSMRWQGFSREKQIVASPIGISFTAPFGKQLHQIEKYTPLSLKPVIQENGVKKNCCNKNPLSHSFSLFYLNPSKTCPIALKKGDTSKFPSPFRGPFLPRTHLLFARATTSASAPIRGSASEPHSHCRAGHRAQGHQTQPASHVVGGQADVSVATPRGAKADEPRRAKGPSGRACHAPDGRENRCMKLLKS